MAYKDREDEIIQSGIGQFEQALELSNQELDN